MGRKLPSSDLTMNGRSRSLDIVGGQFAHGPVVASSGDWKLFPRRAAIPVVHFATSISQKQPSRFNSGIQSQASNERVVRLIAFFRRASDPASRFHGLPIPLIDRSRLLVLQCIL